MTLIQALKPLNLTIEKQKFFHHPDYNPQFIYEASFSPTQLTQYGLPQKKYQQLAEKYLQQKKLIPIKHQLKILSQKSIISQCQKLFHQLGLPLIPIVFLPQHLTRASIKKGQLIINAQAKLTQTQLNSLLAHEVQTHYLRSYNQKLQSFPKNKSTQYIRTEEGLATLNSNFYKNEPNFTGICRQYLGVCQAQKQSFSQIFKWRLALPHTSWNQAWQFTLRVKRGLQDTSQPGGFTKDIVYLEGLIQVCHWLTQPGNQYQDLYLGKIDTSQLPELKAQARTQGLIYPTFMPTLPAHLKRVVSDIIVAESHLL